LETREPSCIARPTKHFFISEAHSPQSAVGHMTASEPTPTERWGPEPLDTRQRRILPWLRGEARSYTTRGSTRAHPRNEARSGAMGHVGVLEPALAGRRGPELQDTWHRQKPP
jgi:hypothetical protein